MFTNACLHSPRIGYDARGHLTYIQTLSQLRLVTPQDSTEFFSPPLPYVLPALLIHLTSVNVLLVSKVAQFFNFLLSLGLTFYLIKTCQLISSQPSLKFGSLIFLGILPVYYKTFAFVRGEPYVAFFALIIVYYTLQMLLRKQFTVAKAVVISSTMGLCALSRQWGILIFPPVFLFLFFQWIRLPQWRYAITKILCLCFVFIFAISGWFYLSLYSEYGSSTAFNRKPNSKFSFRNQPLEFYIGVNHRLLFTNPVRPNFPNQFFPIFYSETWGDYWGYFTIYGKDTRKSTFVNGFTIDEIFSEGPRPYWLETNYEKIGTYLGRVNLVAIFPSALALLSIVFTGMGVLRRSRIDPIVTHQRVVYSFLLLIISTSLAGYFWFLIMYPDIGKGDTIKATYMLQIFPFVAILVGVFMEYIKRRTRFFYRLILGMLCFTAIHNCAAMLTHY